MPPTASPGDLRDAVKARDAVAVARALSGGCKPDDAAERRTLHGAPEVLRGAPGNPVALEPQSVPPLVAAAEGGMADIVELLVIAGASLGAQSSAGRTALVASAQIGDAAARAAVKGTLRAAAGGYLQGDLRDAVAREPPDEAAVAAALAAGGGKWLDYPCECSDDGMGMRPLCKAAHLGLTGVAKLLLAAGAQPDALDGIGWSALMWAAAGGHANAVALLLGNGAELGIKNESGDTALDYAKQALRNQESSAKYVSRSGSGGLATVAVLEASALMPGATPYALGHYIDDEDALHCPRCTNPFGVLRRKHHCRACGQVVCDECSQGRRELAKGKGPVRVCAPSCDPGGHSSYSTSPKNKRLDRDIDVLNTSLDLEGCDKGDGAPAEAAALPLEQAEK